MRVTPNHARPIGSTVAMAGTPRPFSSETLVQRHVDTLQNALEGMRALQKLVVHEFNKPVTKVQIEFKHTKGVAITGREVSRWKKRVAVRVNGK